MPRCLRVSDRRYVGQWGEWNTKGGVECCRLDVQASISSMAARSLVSSQTLARVTCNKPQHLSEIARKTREISPLSKASRCASLRRVSLYCLSSVPPLRSNKESASSEDFRLWEVKVRLVAEREGRVATATRS